MMDLDGFKNVNDSHGHDVGDQVLRAVFNVASVGIRSSDFIARYGGDELTLILTKSDIQAARLVTEKILENIARFSYKAPNGKIIKLGISGGIAIYPSHGRSGPELLRAADAALYDAKKHHRGTFIVAKAATGPLDPLTLNRNKTNGGN
jgi:diguanylate cyclase (GGDEF)-like protein